MRDMLRNGSQISLGKKALVLLVMAVALLIGIQVTRPTTTITLELDGGILRYRVANNSYEGTYDGGEISSISAKRSISAVSETSIESLELNQESLIPRRPSLFFEGRMYGGSSRINTTLPFHQTFGDWAIDHFEGDFEEIAKGPFSPPLVLTAQITGRGAIEIALHGSRSTLVASVRNGLMDNDLSLCVRGADCLHTAFLEEPWTSSIVRLSNTILSWLFLSTLLALVITLLSLVSSKASKDTTDSSEGAAWGKLSWGLVSLLALAHFIIAHRFAADVLGGVPHIPDSVVYMEQARTLAYGLLDITFPPNLPHEPLLTLGGVARGDAMTFWYNRFWPFLLALALRFGIEGIFMPLLSTTTVVLVFSFTSSIAGRRAGLAAAVAYAFSPFTITQSGDFMTHVATSLLILGTLEALRVGISRNLGSLITLAGVSSVFAFGIRPLTTVALAIPALVWFVPRMLSQKCLLRSSGLFALGALPLLCLLLLDNLSITGEALTFPHTRFHSATAGLAALQAGADLMDAQAALLSPILLSTPIVGLSVGMAFLPLVLAPRPRFLFPLAMSMSLLCAYHFWPLNGLHGYGPRFLFEATPYLCALIGIAIITAWDRLPLPAMRAGCCVVVVALCAFNFASLKRELPMYKGYNGIDDEVARSVQRIAQKPSVVLIEGGSWQDQGYANMWIDPTLSDFVAIRRSPEVAWERVLEHYPHHELYSISGGTLSPVTASSSQDDP